MPKSNRFFEIIQMLRAASGPMLARDIAATLEVSTRTIYRDIATLQSMQTPIYGEPGIGYVMRRGYDLPPVNLDIEEAEAIAVGLSLIARTGDPALWRAARRAARKLAEAAPGTRHLIASSWGADAPDHVDPALIRTAIREERKLDLHYEDAGGDVTTRTVWPLALVYYVDSALVAAWCELRENIRHFRLDRMQSCAPSDDVFTGQGASLLARWEATEKADTVTTQPL